MKKGPYSSRHKEERCNGKNVQSSKDSSAVGYKMHERSHRGKAGKDEPPMLVTQGPKCPVKEIEI